MTQPTDATALAVESTRNPKIVKIIKTSSSPSDDEARRRRLAEGRAKAHLRKRKKKYKNRERRPSPPLRDDGPDQLVPDVVACAELGISRMTIWRWSHLPQYRDLAFPPPIAINDRNYRSRKALEAWKRERGAP